MKPSKYWDIVQLSAGRQIPPINTIMVAAITQAPPHQKIRGGGSILRNANRNERSRGRSLLHGQGMGKTQDHKNSIEQWLAVGGWWRLAVGGGWRLAAGDGWRLVAVGSWQLVALGPVLKGCL